MPKAPRRKSISAIPASSAVRVARRDVLTTGWIRELAEPYLRGYRPRLQSAGALRGYWFVCRGSGQRGGERGFFVGYLVDCEGWDSLQPLPPEALVFAFVRPVKGSAHGRLVADSDALVRKTYEYIRWLTHRPPRFAFFESELPALVRHISMRHWPVEKYKHFSRNFFIETLAWLVRSALVRKLAGPPAAPPAREATRRIPA
jgi:hypothetical protein